MAIFLPGIISITTGAVLAFMHSRPNHERRLVTRLAGFAIWLSAAVIGPREGAVQFPIWQVATGRVLDVRFEMSTWQWAWLLVFAGLFLIRLLPQGQRSPDTEYDSLSFVILAFFFLAVISANDLATILLWFFFDIVLAFWRSVQKQPALPSLLLGMASVLLLMTASVLSLPAVDGVNAAGLFSGASRTAAILLAALLRVLSGLVDRPEDEINTDAWMHSMTGVLPAGLSASLVLHAVPLNGAPALLLVGAALVGLLIQVAALLRDVPGNEGKQFHAGLFLAMMCVGLLQTPDVQPIILAAAVSLWLLQFAFHSFAQPTAAWWPWLALIFPLVQAGLPFSPGGLFVESLLAGPFAFTMVPGLISLLLGAIAAWKRWQLTRDVEPRTKADARNVDIVAAVVWLSIMVYPSLRLQPGLSVFGVIAFVVLAAVSGSVLVWGDRLPSLDRPPERARHIAHRWGDGFGWLLGGLRSAYSYSVELASDILEGDGGTLWIIVVVLTALLGLRNLSL